jgi:uncharacterized protein
MAPSAGIGWRHPHYAQVLEHLPRVGFLEVHSENFFADGGAALATLAQARQHYDISLHGVGLGLGSATGVDDWHLERLARLVERINPVRVSDHACFARGNLQQQAVHAADLLPIAFNAASLDVLCANVQRVQDRLQRPLLVENLSAYVQLPGGDLTETEFLNALTMRTGCQLLVDVNNIYVNALNAQALVFDVVAPAPLSLKAETPHTTHPLRDAQRAVQSCRAWLDAIRANSVGEIHLAGHCVMDDMVIDDHGSLVCEGVWQVYAHAVQRFGAVPALIEWDTDIPPLQTLLDEAARADHIGLSLLANAQQHRPAATSTANAAPRG